MHLQDCGGDCCAGECIPNTASSLLSVAAASACSGVTFGAGVVSFSHRCRPSVAPSPLACERVRMIICDPYTLQYMLLQTCHFEPPWSRMFCSSFSCDFFSFAVRHNASRHSLSSMHRLLELLHTGVCDGQVQPGPQVTLCMTAARAVGGAHVRLPPNHGPEHIVHTRPPLQ